MRSKILLPAGNRRVVVFCGHYYPHVGGVERYTRELWGRLARRGWAVTIVTGNTDEAPPFEIVEGLAVIRLPVIQIIHRRLPVLIPGPLVVRAWRVLSAWSPQVVVTNTRFFSTSFLGIVFARRHRIPSLHIDHGSQFIKIGSEFSNALSRAFDRTFGAWVVRRATRCVGVSHAVAAFLARLGRPGAGVLYNGVNSTVFAEAGSGWRERQGIPRDAVMILYIGRLIQDKGILTLLNAMDRLPGDIPVHLVVAGDGHLLSLVRERTKNKGNCHVLGKVPHEEVVELLGSCDIFVHPSAYPEGLPTSVLEAGAAARATVATPMGGTGEVISSPELGIIVPPGDPDKLSEAILSLVQDGDRRRAMGNALQERVRAFFDWERVADTAEEYLYDLGEGQPAQIEERED